MKSILPILLLLSVGLTAQTDKTAVPRQTSFGGLRARSIGPAAMSGRVSDVVGQNSKPEILYVGAANGGVWKSLNAGATFRPTFDEFPQSIGKIAIDQNHPDTVWVGTGEPWVRNSVSIGTGIYVSKNGGNTWEFKGLPNSEHIANVVIDPTDSKTVYVAVQGHLWGMNEERGVYKTTDFGTTWTKILYVDDNTGCADIAMDPKNPKILYASMWEHRRYPDYFDSGGKGSGLFKSTDAGKTWVRLTKGIPDGILGRFGIGVAPSNPNVIYINVECENAKEKGVYKSTDAGASFKRMNGDFNSTVRPFYFSRIVVDPIDENKVYKAGVQGIFSEDGGSAFTPIQGPHSDFHAFWINPKNTNNVYVGCDGGVYRSLDGGKLYEHLKNLPLSQLYVVNVDNETPYNVYCGLQDNNCWYAPSTGNAGAVLNQDWHPTVGGDGFYTFRHPTDKDIVYAESQGGGMVRMSKSTGQSKHIQPKNIHGEPELRFNWNTPIVQSASNPDKIYIGTQYLMESVDRGDSWRKISPDLTTNNPERQRKKSGGLSADWSGAETNTTIVTIAESPKNNNQIWVGTDDGNLQLTTDGGKKWTNIIMTDLATGAPIPSLLWISSIEPSHFDANTCYVVIDGHRSGNMKPMVYRTTDLGKTWTSIVTSDIDAYALCIREDLKNPDLLFMGTEFGLFISIDKGLSWKRFTNNLPKTGIPFMVIHPKEDALVIATHGRGIFILDDITPLRNLTPAIMSEDFHVFEPKTKVLRELKGGNAPSGAGGFYGENPNPNVLIPYYMKKRLGSGDLTAQVFNPQGVLIKTVTMGKGAGVNFININTTLGPPKAAPTSKGESLGEGFISPSLAAGTYTVKIKKVDTTYTTKFAIADDPAITFPAADKALQRELGMKCYNMTEELGFIYANLKALSPQADKLLNEKMDPLAFEELGKLSKEADVLKKTITSTEGDFYIAAETLLRDELAELTYHIISYLGKPNTIEVEEFKRIEIEVAKVRQKYNAIDTRVKAVNTKLKTGGVTEIKLKTFEAYKDDK
jgi:photosystem II stability/assembly factor-like uncharacterized protein